MLLPYVEFKAGQETYKLKINAMAAIELEKAIGTSIVSGMEKLDRISVVSEYLKASLKAHHPDSGDVCLIYDDYITDGGTLEDFTDIMVKVMVVSGFLKREVADKLKAMQEAIAKNSLNMLNQKTPQN